MGAAAWAGRRNGDCQEVYMRCGQVGRGANRGPSSSDCPHPLDRFRESAAGTVEYRPGYESPASSSAISSVFCPHSRSSSLLICWPGDTRERSHPPPGLSSAAGTSFLPG